MHAYRTKVDDGLPFKNRYREAITVSGRMRTVPRSDSRWRIIPHVDPPVMVIFNLVQSQNQQELLWGWPTPG
jgi:hypothetical protein